MVYGIKNCDAVKKARKWLDEHHAQYRFHDFREDGMAQVPLAQWLDTFGWQQVLNQRSTSWRQLSEQQKDQMDNARALSIAREIPTLIKRPVCVSRSGIRFGFSASAFSEMIEKE
jgi:Spx/MgsR family transcriptional regulator